MAKMSILANKKIGALLIRSSKEKFEIAFRNQILNRNLEQTNGFLHCTSEVIKEVAQRASYYGVSIVGVEGCIDEDVPFHEFNIEDYNGHNDPANWILIPLIPLSIVYPKILMKFYIDISLIDIPFLEKITGIQCED